MVAILDQIPKKSRMYKGKSLIDFPDNYVVIDLETTGWSPEWNEIIELSAIRIANNQVADTFTSLVQPKSPVSSFVTEFTGITNGILGSAPRIENALPIFLDFIGSDILVGHNVNFDVNFLYDFAEKLGLPPLQNDFIDTLRLSRRLRPELKNHKLITIAQSLDILPSVIHRGLADCQTTFSVYTGLTELGISKHGTREEFLNAFKRASKSQKLNASRISTDVVDFDEGHPVYGQCFCFTGALEKFKRAEAMQVVADFGGLLGDGVTKKTNYLVIGNFDFSASVKDGKSSKVKKAEKLILDGQDLKIISEDTFYDLIDQ